MTNPSITKRALGALLALGVGLAGCEALLGIDHKHPPAGAGGEAGRADASSASTTGGAAGSGGGGGGASCDPKTAPKPVCAPGTADCNGDPCDGCEVVLYEDGDNCGRCGRSCEGDVCASGMCTPRMLAVSGAYVYDLAVRGGSLYWTHDAPPKVVTVARDGSAFREIADIEPGPAGVAVDDTYVYWASLFSNVYGVARTRIDGTGTVESLCPQESYTDRIALDGDFLYWATSGAPGVRVGRARRDGSACDNLHEMDGSESLPLAVDGGVVYWGVTSGPALGVWSINPDDTPPVAQHLSSLGPVSVLAVDADAIYFADQGSGTILRLPKGSMNATALATGVEDVKGLRVDAVAVYFASTALASVVRVRKDGTGYEPLAAGQDTTDPSLDALAIDDDYVYWTSAGKLFRTPK